MIHHVVVVPAQFVAGVDVGAGEKGHPGKPHVVRVHEAVLDEDVGVAGVVQVAADVADGLGVHDVHVFVLAEKLAGGGVFGFRRLFDRLRSHQRGVEAAHLTLRAGLAVGVFVQDFLLAAGAAVGLSAHKIGVGLVAPHRVVVVSLAVVVVDDLHVVVHLVFVDVALVPFLLPLDRLDHVQLSKVLVSGRLPLLVGLFVGVQVADVDANEPTLGHVVQSSYAPPSFLRLEDLEFDAKRKLGDAIETRRLALAVLVALVDPRGDVGLQSSVGITHVGVDDVFRRGIGVVDGQLPTGALVLILAVVDAVAAGQKPVVQVDVDVLLRQTFGAVLEVVGERVVQGVDARHGDVFAAVRDVVHLAALSFRLKLFGDVQTPIQVEKVDLEFGVRDPQIAMDFAQTSQSSAAGTDVKDLPTAPVLVHALLPPPTQGDGDQKRVSPLVTVLSVLVPRVLQAVGAALVLDEGHALHPLDLHVLERPSAGPPRLGRRESGLASPARRRLARHRSLDLSGWVGLIVVPRVLDQGPVGAPAVVPRERLLTVRSLLLQLHFVEQGFQSRRSPVNRLHAAVHVELKLGQRRVHLLHLRVPPRPFPLGPDHLAWDQANHGALGVLHQVLFDEFSTVQMYVLPNEVLGLFAHDAYVFVPDVGGVAVVEKDEVAVLVHGLGRLGHDAGIVPAGRHAGVLVQPMILVPTCKRTEAGSA